MRIHGIEITTREILFCLVFSFVGIGIFFVINSKFIAEDQDLISKMNQALILDTDEQFHHGIDTDEGHVFSPFKIEPESTWQTTKFQEITDKFLMIEKIREEWTMHTYTTTDSKGRTTTHVYYSWDYAGSKKDYPKNVMFNGIKVPLESLDGFDFRTLKLSSENFNSKKYRISGIYAYETFNSDVRYYYKVIPIEITGSFFGFLGKDFPYDTITIYEGKQPEELYHYLVNWTENKNIIRWAIVIIILLGIGIVFCVRENYWLNK